GENIFFRNQKKKIFEERSTFVGVFRLFQTLQKRIQFINIL
ncbi:unnamed protein product, partial [Brassica oleracea var. botrytis]